MLQMTDVDQSATKAPLLKLCVDGELFLLSWRVSILKDPGMSQPQCAVCIKRQSQSQSSSMAPRQNHSYFTTSRSYESYGLKRFFVRSSTKLLDGVFFNDATATVYVLCSSRRSLCNWITQQPTLAKPPSHTHPLKHLSTNQPPLHSFIMVKFSLVLGGLAVLSSVSAMGGRGGKGGTGGNSGPPGGGFRPGGSSGTYAYDASNSPARPSPPAARRYMYHPRLYRPFAFPAIASLDI